LTLGGIGGVVWWQERPLRLAEAALIRGDAREALRLVNASLTSNSVDERALGIKGRALVALGRWDEAISVFSRVGAANNEELHALAQALLHRQSWSAALPILEQLEKRLPRDPDVLHEITACRAFVGRFDDALRSANELAGIPGQEARAFVQIGTLHHDLGNRKSAVDAWGRVLELTPDANGLQIPAAEFLMGYGGVLIDHGRPQDAIPHLKRSVELQDSAEAWSRLGEAYGLTGQRDESVAAWKRTLELDSTNRRSREALAGLALAQGDARQALDWLRSLSSESDLPSSTMYLLQRIYSQLGESEQAARWQERTTARRRREKISATADQLLRESPQSFWARVMRAYRFAEQGNWIEAEALTEDVLREAPQESFVQELAVAVQRRGELPALEKLPVKLF
jgi:tetratricopeptide (TPR) repeat protein